MTPARLRILAFCVMSYLALLVAARTLKYVTTDTAVFDTLFREKYATHLPVILAHGAAAIAALVIGPAQFVPALRRRWPRIHRVLGRAYMLAILVAAPTGLLMGTMAEGGAVARAAFCSMATLWLATALLAFDTARKRRIPEHRAWMIRNYALTFGAVTLRVYLNALQSAGLDFETIYPWVAWAAWVPNLVVAELLARRAAESTRATAGVIASAPA